MGGKARKRREKNYRAAHGGQARLPPPPNPSQVDALPSKLRKLISLTSNLRNDPAKNPESNEEKTKRRDADAKKKRHREDGITAEATTVKDGGDDGEEIVNSSGDEKRKKKKRKSNQVNDLRFGLALDKTRTVEKRRERKKKYLEAKKKKHKKSNEILDFPGREQIKFGDVVQAPPKLSAAPKLLKNVHDASRVRLRLQAIEAYRNRKAWTSRPGLHLPPPVTTTLPL